MSALVTGAADGERDTESLLGSNPGFFRVRCTSWLWLFLSPGVGPSNVVEI